MGDFDEFWLIYVYDVFTPILIVFIFKDILANYLIINTIISEERVKADY